MVITWYGEGCFKIASGDVSVLTDPFTSDIGLTSPRSKADLILYTSVPHPLPYASRGETHEIVGPGNYEVKGVEVAGWAGQSTATELRTVYRVTIEGMSIGILGALAENPKPELLEELGSASILLVPAGGPPALSPEAAAKLVKQLSPKIVIPSFYRIPGLTRKALDVKTFLDELGKHANPEEKLTLKKKELPQATEVRVLTV
jgi:L-ascorbate metabolism protein UlaG (beta-lactamase superfamily)